MISAVEEKKYIWFFIAALVIAAAFRFIGLGSNPLNDMESEIALQAKAVAEGVESPVGSFPALVGLTGFSFFIFENGNFLARFWNALFGCIIVLIPLLFRKHIGLKGAIVSSFLLAITPEMVSLSRILGSPISAVVFLVLAAGFFIDRRPILLGLSLALGLMSGPGFWVGLLILGLSLLISERIFNISEDLSLTPIDSKKQFWILSGLAFLITIVILGTSFFRAPYVLSGVLSGFLDFITGFWKANPAPWLLLPFSLIAHSLAGFVFGLWGSLRALISRDKKDLFLLTWWLVGLIFVFLYPASQPAEMLWVTLPLWILTGRVINENFNLKASRKFYVGAAALIIIVISAFILLALRSLVNPNVTQPDPVGLLVAIVGGGIILTAVILLIRLRTSEITALTSLIAGLLLVTVASSISISVNSARFSAEGASQLWFPEENKVSTSLMRITIDRILEWNATQTPPIEIIVSDFNEPSMRWALRAYDPVWFVSTLSAQSQPGIIITDVQTRPEISNAYRGQDLVWSRQTLWAEMSPFEYLNFLITRNVPTQDQEMILWVRTDLMPDAQFSP